MAKPAAKDRVAALEDELRQRDARIRELRANLDKAEQLVSEMREQVEDSNTLIESWIEAFDMMLDEHTGKWRFKPWIDTADAYHDKYVALLRDWNRFVGQYNAIVQPRNVGRPLAASDAQVAQVLKLRQRGLSLRGIADETNLGLPTVRTIVDRRDGRDRTTVKHLARIDPDRKLEASWQARRRTRKSLPKRIDETLAKGRELIKAAKGLK
jgi:hypothetical protein